MKKVSRGAAAMKALKTQALSLPGAFEDHPWGDTVVKVSKKIFVFLGVHDGGEFGLSVKLPQSAVAALTLPFAEPTGYGLGKSGWVSTRFAASDDIPLELLTAWILESYRAIAPATLVKQLDASGDRRAAPTRTKAPSKRKAR